MNHRFEIEELVAQDSFRVVYRAMDRKSGRLVAIRRLLPEGPGGEGYDETKAAQFDAAVQALASVDCPGLRHPVAWGVDPVDHQPFIASEWVEGKTLAELLKDTELPAESGWRLAESALIAQEALDATGHGWQIDVSPESILVADADTGFQFSFWVAPFPGSAASVAMVKDLASVIELAMGWRGRVPAANAGMGLAGWLRLVKQHRMDAPDAKHVLAEARRQSQPAVTQPPDGSPAKAAPEPQPLPPSAPSSSPPADGIPQPPSMKALGGALILLILLAAVGGWWFWKQTHSSQAAHGKTGPNGTPSSASAHQMTPAEKASARAAELAKKAAEKGDIDVSKHIFTPSEGALLRDFIGQDVTFQGVLKKVRNSTSGKTRYLEFSDDRGVDNPCGIIKKKNLKGNGLAMRNLKPLVGHKIQLHGKVIIENPTGRVAILILHRNQISKVDPPKE